MVSSLFVLSVWTSHQYFPNTDSSSRFAFAHRSRTVMLDYYKILRPMLRISAKDICRNSQLNAIMTGKYQRIYSCIVARIDGTILAQTNMDCCTARTTRKFVKRSKFFPFTTIS